MLTSQKTKNTKNVTTKLKQLNISIETNSSYE